jgi:hypothetical protein
MPSFAYPAPFEFDQEAPVTPSRPKGHVETSLSLPDFSGQQASTKEHNPNKRPSHRQNRHRDHHVPDSPRRREPSHSSLESRRSRNSDQVFFGNLGSEEEGKLNRAPSRRQQQHNHHQVPESPRRREHHQVSESSPRRREPVPESPRRREPPVRASIVRSKSNDDAFFGSLKDKDNDNDGQQQQAAALSKPRPAFPRTKSGRCLPKPIVPRSQTASGGLNKNGNKYPKSRKEDFVRKPPRNTQSASNLDSMRQQSNTIAEEILVVVPASSSRGGKSRMPPPSPRGKSGGTMPPPSPRGKTGGTVPASSSRRKLWLMSPGKKGKEGVENRSFSKLKGMLSTSDHGPSPTTPKPKLSLNQTVHTASPSGSGDNNTGRESRRENRRESRRESSDEKKPTKTFQQLLSKKKPGRSKSSDLTGMVAPRERSMSPINKNDRPKSLKELPPINLHDDDDVSLSPEPSKPASAKGVVAGLWSSFNGSFRRDDDDDESDQGFGLKSPSQQRGRTMVDRKITSPRDEGSLSPIAVKKPASTGGLITGFIDKMYDSFMNEDDDNGSDDEDFGMMQNSISRLDVRINQLAGLQ